MSLNKVKIFISYCHEDLKKYDFISKFKLKMEPNNNLIDLWYDEEIIVSEFLNEKIEENLNNSDICCIFLSKNYLNSISCKEELNKSFELLNSKNMKIFPIILEDCDWKYNFSEILSSPQDAKPLFSYDNPNEAWTYIIKNLNKLIYNIIYIKSLELSDNFTNFLNEVDVFTKAHDKKENIDLNDIFIYPDLKKYDYNYENGRIISSEYLINNIIKYPKFILSGESQSGKTTLSKILFKTLKSLNFVPVYINDSKNFYKKNIERIIKKELKKQYNEIDYEKLDKKRDIIPIIDDFHFAINANRTIKDLTKYKKVIYITDDIYNLTFNQKLQNLPNFLIQEYKPSLRAKLIRKWLEINNKEDDNYNALDRNIEMIERILGKDIGKGIVPSYPFFILSAIVNFNTFQPLNQKITSQAYYYQIIIYYFLHKKNVKPEEYDIYLNFLTEISFYIYKSKKYTLPSNKFQEFIEEYKDKYLLPIRSETLLEKLKFIFSSNSLKEYSFKQDYFYYYFIAKYFAENINNENIKSNIENMIKNLHVDRNSYIIIFISHHTKDDYLLKLLSDTCKSFFKEYKTVELSKEEINFIDKNSNFLVERTIENNDPDSERKKRNKFRDKQEQETIEFNETSEKNPIKKEIRRSIKTVEVMGSILKNRSGSLKKEDMINLFKEGMSVHLRILGSIFDLIENEDIQKKIISEVSKFIEDNLKENLSKEELNKLASLLFWNYIFILINSSINKIVHSLGSENIKFISAEVFEELKTPSSYLVNLGIWMWYDKSIPLEEISNEINNKKFSETAKKSIFDMIYNHCALHNINYREIKRIENKLNFKIINKPKMLKN